MNELRPPSARASGLGLLRAALMAARFKRLSARPIARAVAGGHSAASRGGSRQGISSAARRGGRLSVRTPTGESAARAGHQGRSAIRHLSWNQNLNRTFF